MNPHVAARRTRVGFLVIALAVNLVLVGVLDVREVQACSCVGTPLDARLEELDAVFAGEVTEIEEDELAPGVGPPLGRVVFDVSESWKGTLQQSVAVYGQGPGASCGLDFDEGKSYLVFAYHTDAGPGNPLETNLCEATKPLAEAEDDLRLLGSSSDALPDTGGFTVSPLDRETMGFAAVILALLTLTGMLAIRRRGGI